MRSCASGVRGLRIRIVASNYDSYVEQTVTKNCGCIAGDGMLKPLPASSLGTHTRNFGIFRAEYKKIPIRYSRSQTLELARQKYGSYLPLPVAGFHGYTC